MSRFSKLPRTLRSTASDETRLCAVYAPYVRMAEFGAGEILLTSRGGDGIRDHFDIELAEVVAHRMASCSSGRDLGYHDHLGGLWRRSTLLLEWT